MVLLKMLMDIVLPKQGELLMMMRTMISPPGGKFPGGIAPPEGKSAPAQLPPRDGGAPSRKSSPYCFLGQNDIYTRRWAPEVGRGGQHPPGRAWASWHAHVGCAHLVAPLWYLFAPIILKYSIKNPRGVSAHLELCRIGSLTQLFQVQISSCHNSPPWCIPCIL